MFGLFPDPVCVRTRTCVRVCVIEYSAATCMDLDIMPNEISQADKDKSI